MRGICQEFIAATHSDEREPALMDQIADLTQGAFRPINVDEGFDHDIMSTILRWMNITCICTGWGTATPGVVCLCLR
jgi:hypothetical protein